MLELKNICFAYDTLQKTKYKIFENYSIAFPTGKPSLIYGESGCGKSTLAKILCGKIKNYTGEISYNGEVLSNSDLNKYVYYLPAKLLFMNGLTIYENLFVALASNDNKELSHKIIDVLDKLELKKKVNAKFKNLSSGQKQRVLIAYALLLDCPIIILDEITQSIDEASLVKYLRLFESENKTLLFISHKKEIFPFEFAVEVDIEKKTIKANDIIDSNIQLNDYRCVKHNIFLKHLKSTKLVYFSYLFMLFLILGAFYISMFISSNNYSYPFYTNKRRSPFAYELKFDNTKNYDLSYDGITYNYYFTNQISTYVHGRKLPFYERSLIPNKVSYGREIENEKEIVISIPSYLFKTYKGYINCIYYPWKEFAFCDAPMTEFEFKVVGIIIYDYSYPLVLCDKMSFDYMNEYNNKYGNGDICPTGNNDYYPIKYLKIDNFLDDFVLRSNVIKGNITTKKNYKGESATLHYIYDSTVRGTYLNQRTYDFFFKNLGDGSDALSIYSDEYSYDHDYNIIDKADLNSYFKILSIKYSPINILSNYKILLGLILIFTIIYIFFNKRYIFYNFIKMNRRSRIILFIKTIMLFSISFFVIGSLIYLARYLPFYYSSFEYFCWYFKLKYFDFICFYFECLGVMLITIMVGYFIISCLIPKIINKRFS